MNEPWSISYGEETTGSPFTFVKIKPDKRLHFDYFSFNHFAALEDCVSRTSIQPPIETPIDHHPKTLTEHESIFRANNLLPLFSTKPNHDVFDRSLSINKHIERLFVFTTCIK